MRSASLTGSDMRPSPKQTVQGGRKIRPSQIGNPGTRRILAHLLRRSPLPFFSVFWLLGQTMGYVVAPSYLFMCIVFYGMLLFVIPKTMVLSAASAGIAGVISVMQLQLLEQSSSPASFVAIAQVSGEVRAPKPGRINVPMTIQAQIPQHREVPSIGTRVLCATKDLPWRNGAALAFGDLVWIRGSMQSLAFDGSPADFRRYLQRRGFSAECVLSHVSTPIATQSSPLQSIRSTIRDDVQSIAGEGEKSGVLLAMLAGANDTLSRELVEGLSRVSLTHVLVVSGYQVTLWYSWIWILLLVFVSRAPYLVRGLSRCLALGVVWLYIAVIGMDPSCVRAGIAISICELFALTERRSNDSQGIALALLIVTAVWPGSFFEMGTQLTFAALITLRVSSTLLPDYLPQWLNGLAASLCTTTITSLVIACWDHEVDIWGILLNPVVVPIVSLLSGPVAAAGYLAWLVSLDSSGVLVLWTADRILTLLYAAAEIGGPLVSGPPAASQSNYSRIAAVMALAGILSFLVRRMMQRVRITRGYRLSAPRR